MQIVRDLAGYSYGRSDLVRRAMSKKKADVMAQEKQWFIYGKEREDGTVEVPGCLRNGITKDAAETIFADMESFASYAFNKAHAAAYAVVAFETGWLKRYYPVEFMAALMTSVKGDTSAVAKYIAACREMGIEVLPPSVNESERKFSVEGNKIRFGLQAVKNVGDNAIDAIIRVRRERGKFRDIFTLIDEIDTSVVNKKAMESLIKAGALDCLSPNRAAMLAVYDQLMDSAQASARNNLAGQMSLFQTERSVMETAAMSGGLPDVKNFDPGFLLALEKEYTGVYITDHPLNRYAKRIRRIVNLYTRDLAGTGEEGAGAEDGSGSPLQDGQRVILAGMVAGRRNLITKSNKMMAYVQLEDLYGTCEIIVFPNVLERFGEALTGDRVIVVTGRLDCREEEAPKVLAETIVAIDEYDESAPPQAYPRRDGNGYERSYGGRSGAGGSGGRENGRGYSGSDGASGSRNGGGSGRLGNGNAGGSGNHAGAVKVRLPAFGSQEGSGGALSDEELLEELKKILRRYPGNREVLIYSRNGKVLSGGNMRVRPTLDFAEETALLVGNANIKIKEIAR